MLLLLLLLPLIDLGSTLRCSQCQELLVDGAYYNNNPRDCVYPHNVTCNAAEDRCISAGINFDLLQNNKAPVSRIEFSLKYCGRSDITCAGIELEMMEGVDYGNVSNFECFIGTKCQRDFCNRFIPGRRPVTELVRRPVTQQPVTRQWIQTTFVPEFDDDLDLQVRVHIPSGAGSLVGCQGVTVVAVLLATIVYK